MGLEAVAVDMNLSSPDDQYPGLQEINRCLWSLTRGFWDAGQPQEASVGEVIRKDGTKAKLTLQVIPIGGQD